MEDFHSPVLLDDPFSYDPFRDPDLSPADFTLPFIGVEITEAEVTAIRRDLVNAELL